MRQVGCLENNTGEAKGCSVSDFKCLCSSTPYINAISCCIEKSCSTTDQEGMHIASFDWMMLTSLATLQFEIEVCDMYNISIPNFLGCSPLSSSISYAAGTSETSQASSGIATSTILTVAAAFTTSIGGPIAQYQGAALMTGTCTLPYIASTSISQGSILNYPWTGCSDEHPDCCPWQLDSQGPLTGCPADYITTSGACCPFGWAVYSSTLAGQTPCVTAASVALVPPASTQTSNKIISNQMFSLRYILAAPSTGPSMSTQIGVGVGLGLGGLLIIALAAYLLWKRRNDEHLKQATIYRSQHEMMRDQPAKPLHNSTIYSPTVAHQDPDAPRELHSPDAPTFSARSQKSGTNWSAVTPITPATPAFPPIELAGSTFIYEHHPALRPAPEAIGIAQTAPHLPGEVYRSPLHSTESLPIHRVGTPAPTETHRPPFQSAENLATHRTDL